VALTIIAHLIYGYMAAATLVLAAALPDGDSRARNRFVRLAWIGAVSFALTAFVIVPMLGSAAFINRSRWEPAWKWESFGIAQVLRLVATGDLVDAGRRPIVALFALAGTIAILRTRDRTGRFAVAGSLLWTSLFAGSKTWGPLFHAIGVGDQVQTHRFIGGLHWFLMILAGIGLARLWMWRRFWGVAISLVLLAFPVAERIQYMRDDHVWGAENLAAYESQRNAIDRVAALLRARGGRAYAGLDSSWGTQFKVGYVPFYAFLSRQHVPAVAFPYHGMALPADIMVRFDERRPDHYRLFDIRSAVAESTRPMQPFLTPIANIGNFRVYAAPPSSSFDLVSVPYSIYADRRTFYDVNDAWLQSGWVASRTHALIDYGSRVPTYALPRLATADAFAQPAAAPLTLGSILAERATDDRYEADVSAITGCFLLLKSTYHPNWRVDVDGTAQPVVMLTPGFAAVRLASGRHLVSFSYAHGAAKTALLGLAFPLLAVALFAERRGYAARKR
ncbi:MAG TPA: hypothetical protein VLU46_07520, partial [Thermoanaerobaculia bacterium]|nr:hypothetical protein [Thermoanaerobaculia bacterium]